MDFVIKYGVLRKVAVLTISLTVHLWMGGWWGESTRCCSVVSLQQCPDVAIACGIGRPKTHQTILFFRCSPHGCCPELVFKVPPDAVNFEAVDTTVPR